MKHFFQRLILKIQIGITKGLRFIRKHIVLLVCKEQIFSDRHPRYVRNFEAFVISLITSFIVGLIFWLFFR